MNEIGSRPGHLNLRAYQGDSYTLGVSLAGGGSPVDLTNMEIEFSLAVARGARPAFKYTSDGPYVQVTDPGQGKIQINVLEDETKKWQDMRYVYELTVRDGAGYAETFLTGDFRVQREVVR